MTKTGHSNTSIPALQKRFQKAHLAGQTWKQIGAQYIISGGLAHRIAYQGYEPHDPIIRFRLGLSSMLPAPVCQRCGIVHVAKRCTARKKKKPAVSSSLAELLWLVKQEL